MYSFFDSYYLLFVKIKSEFLTIKQTRPAQAAAPERRARVSVLVAAGLVFLGTILI